MTKVRVAIIGSGLAGLTLSHLLQLKEENIEVHLFERSNQIGMDKASITVKLENTTFRLDSPMRSINGGSHTRVMSLYRYLKVSLKESNFSYTFFRITPSTPKASSSSPPPYSTSPILEPLFIYEGSNGLKFPPLAIPSGMSSWFQIIPYFIHLLLITFSYIHLLLLAFIHCNLGLTSRKETNSTWKRIIINIFGLKNVGEISLEKFCSQHLIWKGMREELLYPLFAAVSTVGRVEVGKLPVGEVLVGTFGSSHYVTSAGVQEVVKLLTANLPPSQIHLSASISSLSTSPINPLGTRLHFDSSMESMDFDHVVFSTQANQAKTLLETLSSGGEDGKKRELSKLEMERSVALGQFEYVRTLVINHTDSSILPPSTDRRDLNLVSYAPSSIHLPSPFVNSDSKEDLLEGEETDQEDYETLLLPPSSIQATHIISRTHPHLVKTLPNSILLLQTTNPIVVIDPTKILSTAWFERIKVSFASKKVISRFILPDKNSVCSNSNSEGGDGFEEGDIQGVGNIWFVGSWCDDGLPLLEGCVSSAEKVAMELIKRSTGEEMIIPY